MAKHTLIAMSVPIYTINDEKPANQHAFDLARDTIARSLRVEDMAYMLPGAHHDRSSQTLKNCIIALDGDTPNVPYQLLSPSWAFGISVVRLSDEDSFRLNQAMGSDRSAYLDRLLAHIPSMTTGNEVNIGPLLEANATCDHDDDQWISGFDSDDCCAGVYATIEDHPPPFKGRKSHIGMTRGYKANYIVVRAGAGRAAESFHVKLQSELRSGKSLNAAMEAVAKSVKATNADALLRRLVAAGKRNRARIVLAVAKALNLTDVTTSLDHNSNQISGSRQMATLHVDTVTNVFERSNVPQAELAGSSKMLYFAGSVAPASSQGMVISSNIAEGFVMYRPPSDGTATGMDWTRASATTTVSNAMYGSLPFYSEVVLDDTAAMEIAKQSIVEFVNATVSLCTQTTDPSEYVKQVVCQSHPDSEWLRRHFRWHPQSLRRRTGINGALAQRGNDKSLTNVILSHIEPPSLWGMFSPSSHAQWARSMSTHELKTLTLRPKLVLIAHAEFSKVRTVARSLSESIDALIESRSKEVSTTHTLPPSGYDMDSLRSETHSVQLC